ncbi:MAG: DUF5063 domain-containing protein [Planctomycetes bacterium]|nr:DUF5063 domain-containing protein [Planctomycetota bacterium]
MHLSEIHKAVVDFLDLITRDRPAEDQDIETLEDCLDRLALGYRRAHYEFEDGHPDPPDVDYPALRERTIRRFPMFGYYNIPEFITSKLMESPLITGDAIDDLTDIARDLMDVRWCWEHTSPNDAMWHFRIGFETHWGGHLRNLQWYIQGFKDEH